LETFWKAWSLGFWAQADNARASDASIAEARIIFSVLIIGLLVCWFSNSMARGIATAMPEHPNQAAHESFPLTHRPVPAAPPRAAGIILIGLGRPRALIFYCQSGRNTEYFFARHERQRAEFSWPNVRPRACS
jgi:hypothetical protein